MNQFHDPVRQESYLRQSLAQDKRPLGLFLGAGCPLAIRVPAADGTEMPLIPDVAGLTKTVFQKMSASDEHKTAFETVVSHLQSDTEDANPNIENILSHIRSLKAVAGKDTIRGLTASDLGVLDEVICATIVDMVNKSLPDSNSPYHKVAAWVGAIARTEPVEIFTTNYDLLMEQALEDNRVPYFDGFIGSHRTFFDPLAMEEDPLPARWARLWKLHGSINWRQNERSQVSRGEQVPIGQRRVIHPSHLKYDESRRMPYLAMLDRLRAFLKKPSSVLIVCGYSFRDDHLNEVMIQGLQGNPTAITFALLFGKLQDYPNATKLAAHRANLSLMSDDEAVIGTKRSNWSEKADHGIHKVEQAKFKLGDFACFGTLLQDLIGTENNVGEDTDAK